jgi:predicted SAM-dependent methyltransferase
MLSQLIRFIQSIKIKQFVAGVKNKKHLKLNLGAGGKNFPGWFSAEKYQLDITKCDSFKKIFSEASIASILVEHVIEHIQKQEFIYFLHAIKPFLQPGANIRVAVPDAYHPSAYVRDLTRPCGLEPGADDHKEFYSIETFREIATLTGYTLIPIEFFDAKGFFSYFDYDVSSGYISRCKTNYQGRFTENLNEYQKMIDTTPQHLREQFVTHRISYTSLLVDFVKDI